MGKAEPNCCWDDVVDEASKDEKFDNILDILDFPIESLEDDEFVGDWDVSKSLCLGPIPSDVLMGPPVEPKIDTGPLRQPVAKIGDGTSDAQEPNASQMQSPISVLESSGSHSAEKGLLITSRTPPIPVGTRSKRVRPSAEPWFLRSPFLASKTTKERRTKKDSTRRAKNLIFEESDSIVEPQNTSCATKKCSHCEVTKTPQWREGPAGPKTLCNACGVRFRSGRLFPEYRPAASPTFVPSIHSNSHRKVIEMRNRGKQKASGVEITPISPEIEFIHMNNSYLFDSV